nr:apoptosis-inducing factor 3-like [Leptinotarsa decemlineata]
MSSSDNYIEETVCQVSELQENELKTFQLGDGEVLLVKQNGKISALGSKCTHYGAPLANGALGEGRIRCPWHGACFNLATGDIEDFPGLDSLPNYQVTIDGSNVVVRADKGQLVSNKRVKNMVGQCQGERHGIVVIGGGPAAATCVETLRQEGYKGQIVMVCKENCLPYDRVLVTKEMNFDIKNAEFRNDDFYQKFGISVIKGVEALSVDTKNKKVSLSNSTALSYHKLFIATGSSPRKVDIPGCDLGNVIVLRDYENAKYTNSQLSKDKEVVILGDSFIALEAADYCSSRVKKVTVLMKGQVPFSHVLGPRIGRAVFELFRRNGVNFVTQCGLRRINGNGGNVQSVELVDGTSIPADLLIVGIGITLNTTFLKDSGIEIQQNGSIETDQYLQTNIPEVYAGGDVAWAPVWCAGNQKASIGHFGLAHYHGKTAALNMIGKQKELRSVPYFWTRLFGLSIRYCGFGHFDDIIYVGDVEALKFVAFYLKSDEVVSASSCGMDPIVSKFGELLAQGKKLKREDLVDDPLGWTKPKLVVQL